MADGLWESTAQPSATPLPARRTCKRSCWLALSARLPAQMLATHVNVMLEHSRSYDAAVGRQEGLEDILSRVAGLVDRVSASFPQTLQAREQSCEQS